MTDLETKLKEAKEEARQQNIVASAGKVVCDSTKLQPCNWEAAANLNVQLTGTEAGMNAMTFFHHLLYWVASCEPMVSLRCARFKSWP